MTESAPNGGLAFSDACERNKHPILEVLEQHFPKRGFVLEIGSGTGQHVVYFAEKMTTLKWQPSDLAENLPALVERVEAEGGDNVKPPIALDIRDGDEAGWPERVLSAAFSANTAHIMSWSTVRTMFEGVGKRLKERGVFCLYGPFNDHGKYTSDSNRAFDLQLKSQDPEMGLRDVKSLETLAEKFNMRLADQVRMPANNHTLVFVRKDNPR
ncbi:MAG: DUF938 domain-containing protein [Xanthomonadales bacterium]|nr:DUF938 domain-containing protein [Xanthomonadales bacterium]